MIAVIRAAVAAAVVFVPAAAQAQAAPLQGTALIEALRGGGYVILMRHAATEAKLDAQTVDVADCTTQRNLSPEGRATARAIGARVSALALPIADVKSSPFCRALESARLIFGRADPVDGLHEYAVKDAAARADAAAALRPLLVAPPPAGKDLVVVTHGFNVKSVTGLDVLEAEAVVVKPDTHGGYAVVGDIKADDWNTPAN
jgi:phosphohistidine phosphatase SixA